MKTTLYFVIPLETKTGSFEKENINPSYRKRFIILLPEK